MPNKIIPELKVDPTNSMANKYGFYIEIFHINSRKTVRFKAFMKDFNDVYNTSYDDQFFIGQTEPIKKWKSTVRQIDIAFAAVASGLAEARDNLAKVSLLTNMLYPEQQADGDGMITKLGGSPIFKVRFLNLIGAPGIPWGDAWQTGLQGYISNLLYRIDPEGGILFHAPSSLAGAKEVKRPIKPSERALGQDHLVYPQTINLSFTFFPVYERSPGWRTDSDIAVFTVNKNDVSDYPYGVNTKEGEATDVQPKGKPVHGANAEFANAIRLAEFDAGFPGAVYSAEEIAAQKIDANQTADGQSAAPAGDPPAGGEAAEAEIAGATVTLVGGLTSLGFGIHPEDTAALLANPDLKAPAGSEETF